MATDRQSDHAEDADTDKEYEGKDNFMEVMDAIDDYRQKIANINSYIQSLPKSVKRRIKALKKLTVDASKVEAKFYEEIHELECKYQTLYEPFFEKRMQIINGNYEPNDDECDFPLSDEEEEDEKMAHELKVKVNIENQDKTAEEVFPEDTKGVPEFWYKIFKNAMNLSEMVEPHDEPILKHLIDLKVKVTRSPMGFILEFYFAPNEYFTNCVLTKEYEMKCVPEETDPFGFEGPEIFKCKGCSIDWKPGKNVTVKTVKKRQKHKSRGAVRTVVKTIQNNSFFNFFSPPVMPDDPNVELDEETQSLLTADFEIGHLIREAIIPRAVLYYTGEAVLDESEDEEDEEDDEDEEEEDEEEDDVDEGVKKGKPVPGQNPSECKQQ